MPAARLQGYAGLFQAIRTFMRRSERFPNEPASEDGRWISRRALITATAPTTVFGPSSSPRITTDESTPKIGISKANEAAGEARCGESPRRRTRTRARSRTRRDSRSATRRPPPRHWRSASRAREAERDQHQRSGRGRVESRRHRTETRGRRLPDVRVDPPAQRPGHEDRRAGDAIGVDGPAGIDDGHETAECDDQSEEGAPRLLSPSATQPTSTAKTGAKPGTMIAPSVAGASSSP